MNRNVESHFSELPKVDIERSIFDRSCSHKTSFNVGELIPFYLDEVLPGDTFKVTTSCVVRLQTLLTPVMDNAYLDTYFFYVRNRNLWTHWKEFCGENNESAWMPETTYTPPVVTYPENGFAVGTIADYLGIPTGVNANNEQNTQAPLAFPFRGYAQICDQFFRDQNLTDPLNIPLGDANQTGSNGDSYISDVANGGKPFKVAKYHDYFTSCLPSPQKGPAVNIFGQPISSEATGKRIDFLKSVPVATGSDTGNYGTASLRVSRGVDGTIFNTERKLVKDTSDNTVSVFGTTSGDVVADRFIPTNLWASMIDLPLSINELRLAFQLQKYYEKNARGGTRYRELIKQHFGVTTLDGIMQIPEYLGGHRFPLSIHQVANTSQGESDFLGDLGAMSNTSDVHDDFIKSFDEHGYVIGVCCVRYDHSYPQGLERFWSRRNVTDWYFPVFANIGEQPVYKREIYLGAAGNGVFGYQEAWADYRYKPNRVSGEMRPGIQNSLASWHFADYYTQSPSLSDGWIREDKANVDRTLAVTSAVSNQVFADFYVKNECTRTIPMYSIPGLIDHH